MKCPNCKSEVTCGFIDCYDDYLSVEVTCPTCGQDYLGHLKACELRNGEQSLVPPEEEE